MKKKIKYGLLFILAFSVLTFLYLVYFGENRISLIIHQGVDAPHGLYDVSIERRRSLMEILLHLETDANSSCKTSKENLNEWLKTSNFQSIWFFKDTTSKEIYYHSYESLPPVIIQKIIQNKISYKISLRIPHDNYANLLVVPIDKDNVSIEYASDWN